MAHQDPNSIVERLHQGHPVDPVHPDHSQMMKSKYPVIECNKFFQALSSLNFGGQSQLQIPNAGVVKQVLVNGVLSGVAGGTLCDNVGYAMIEQIQYRIGNSTLYQIDGVDNWNIICSQLRTQEAIAEAYSLAGGDAAALGAGATKEFSIAISTPYSRFMLMSRQYGIDASIMRTPLQINIKLKPTAQVYTAGVVNALASANFQIIESDYMDRSNRLVPKDGQFLSLPTRYFQSYTTRAFTPASITENNTVDLLGFRKGNLIGMIITGHNVANIQGTAPFAYNTLSNMVITFNGVNIYVSLGTNFKLQQLRNAVGAYSYHTIASAKQYRIEPSFTPNHWGQAGHNFNYGIMLNAQALQCSFTSSSTASQIVKVLYVYDGVILYNEDQQDLVL